MFDATDQQLCIDILSTIWNNASAFFDNFLPVWGWVAFALGGVALLMFIVGAFVRALKLR